MSSTHGWTGWMGRACGVPLVLLLGSCGSGVLSVTHGEDTGTGSLRAALARASSDLTVRRIRIDPTVRRVGLAKSATFSGTQRLTIEGSGTIIEPAGGGTFDLLVTKGGGGLALEDLVFQKASGSAVVVSVPPSATGRVRVSLSEVTMVGNGLFGLLVDEADSTSASIELSIASSRFGRNGLAEGVTDIDAVRVNESGPGDIVATIRNSRLEGNGGDGVELDESGAGNVELRVRRSRFSGNGAQDPDDPEDGLDIDETGEGDILAILDGIEVARNADEGVDFDEEDDGNVETRLVGAEARDNVSDGVSVGEEGDGDLAATIRRSTVSRNGAAGVKVRQRDDGKGVLRLRQTVLEGNREGPIDAKGAEVDER